MSERLPFGTVGALFDSPAAAQAPAAVLAREGYPRRLVTVLTGQPWSKAPEGPRAVDPDPELGVALLPDTPADTATLREPEPPDPLLAAFTGGALGRRRRRRNRALWPLVLSALGVVATLIALYGRDWIVTTWVGLIAFQVVVAALILSYARAHVATFPFRSQIPDVEQALARGGALVTVRCTLPYLSTVRATLERSGGRVLGYAAETVYPVPA